MYQNNHLSFKPLNDIVNMTTRYLNYYKIQFVLIDENTVNVIVADHRGSFESTMSQYGRGPIMMEMLTHGTLHIINHQTYLTLKVIYRGNIISFLLINMDEL